MEHSVVYWQCWQVRFLRSVFLYGINIYMIVQSITNSWDMVYNKYRNTEYRTLVDPKTNKTVLEVIQYLYNNTGKIEPVTKGQVIDILIK